MMQVCVSGVEAGEQTVHNGSFYRKRRREGGAFIMRVWYLDSPVVVLRQFVEAEAKESSSSSLCVKAERERQEKINPSLS